MTFPNMSGAGLWPALVGAVLVLSCTAFAAAPSQPPDLGQYGRVLMTYVRDDGRADYAGIKTSGALDEFVKQLAAVSPDSHPTLFPSREAKLAYWINAYNALVLHAFAKQYPEKRDRLKGVLGKAVFFYRTKHVVGGRSRTLADIEDRSIRSFGDPRIHFAIVCASTSCPALSRKPYLAETLNEQLESETQKYFSDGRNFAIDTGRREVRLPKIFEWFRADFGKTSEQVIDFVARYREKEAAGLRAGSWKIAYFEYDWSPNDIRR